MGADNPLQSDLLPALPVLPPGLLGSPPFFVSVAAEI